MEQHCSIFSYSKMVVFENTMNLYIKALSFELIFNFLKILTFGNYHWHMLIILLENYNWFLSFIWLILSLSYHYLFALVVQRIPEGIRHKIILLNSVCLQLAIFANMALFNLSSFLSPSVYHTLIFGAHLYSHYIESVNFRIRLIELILFLRLFIHFYICLVLFIIFDYYRYKWYKYLLV